MFDVVVAGLGAMGSASLRALARRGLRVLGIDRFVPPHAFGSSHGDTRIIREAYFEDPAYVPLVQRAYLLWDELERECGRTLFVRTGGMMIGPRQGAIVAGALRSAEVHGLAHELLDAEQIRARVPAFQPSADMVGVWEPRAGTLRPEFAIAAFLDSAQRHGATLRFEETVQGWRSDGAGVVVTTSRGVHRAARLVLTPGAWLPDLVPALGLAVERQVLYWFEPIGVRSAHDACPISIWEYEPGRYFYSFPRTELGVKVALHGGGAPAHPDRLDREVHPEEVAAIRAVLQRHLPFASGPLRGTAVCMYTNTADGHFRIGPHPEHDRVLVVSACSGHGFKFTPTIGEIVSDLLVDGGTRHDIGLFRIGAPSHRDASRPASHRGNG